MAVAVYGDQGPQCLDRPEGPGAGKEAISARQCAAAREGEDEARIPSFKRVHRHHEYDCASAKESEHGDSWGAPWVANATATSKATRDQSWFVDHRQQHAASAPDDPAQRSMRRHNSQLVPTGRPNTTLGIAPSSGHP